jgi:hypothetical protein
METKRLVPYSVHLREDVYLKLKEAAKGRKASAIVRDAITMIIEGDDAFSSGYTKGMRDAIKIIKADSWANNIAVHDQLISDALAEQLEKRIGVHDGNKT